MGFNVAASHFISFHFIHSTLPERVFRSLGQRLTASPGTLRIRVSQPVRPSVVEFLPDSPTHTHTHIDTQKPGPSKTYSVSFALEFTCHIFRLNTFSYTVLHGMCPRLPRKKVHTFPFQWVIVKPPFGGDVSEKELLPLSYQWLPMDLEGTKKNMLRKICSL